MKYTEKHIQTIFILYYEAYEAANGKKCDFTLSCENGWVHGVPYSKKRRIKDIQELTSNLIKNMQSNLESEQYSAESEHDFSKSEQVKMNKITSPTIGSIVRHTGWGFENDSNYPCDVYIVSGNYFINGRLNNHWYWQRILSDGKFAPEKECGYGSFEKIDYEYIIGTEKKIIKL